MSAGSRQGFQVKVTATPETRDCSAAVDLGKGVFQIDPIADPRWAAFLRTHSEASLFHSPAWLESLQRTYGYLPRVFTTASPNTEKLTNGIVFCEVKSSFTGNRLVSLPFSDFCEPLAEDPANLPKIIAAIEEQVREGGWRYFELRPTTPVAVRGDLWRTSSRYYHYEIDLRPDADALFSSLHKDSIQRKIKRADREGLHYEEGTGADLLQAFYRLLALTRCRHGVPPQPLSWFRELVHCFGDTLQIRIARKDKTAVAAMMTIRYKDTLVYKYGGSDARFNRLGGMHMLYWRSIQDAKNWGLRRFDLGRTDQHQTGLITFKKRWGGRESTITYWRYGDSGNVSHAFEPSSSGWGTHVARFVFSHMPQRLTPVVGKVLYRHFG